MSEAPPAIREATEGRRGIIQAARMMIMIIGFTATLLWVPVVIVFINTLIRGGYIGAGYGNTCTIN